MKSTTRTLFILIPLILIVFVMHGQFAHANTGLNALLGIGTIASDAVNTLVANLVNITIVPIASLTMSTAGYLMDAFINYSLDMSPFTSGAGALAIDAGWTAIRDVCNMLFIFVLLYVSISTILQTNSFSAKSTLKNVIIAALLINFSLFATRVVIDTGNVFAVWFLEGIYAIVLSGTEGTGVSPSISAAINASLGVFKLYNPLEGGLSSATAVLSGFARAALMLIAAYVFFYAGFLFLARTVSFAFLMIFSPIGFIGGLLPALKPYSDRWFNELMKQVFMAPVFLLMLYIIMLLINTNAFVNTTRASGGGYNPLGTQFQISDFFGYFVIIFFLLAAIKTAKSMSGEAGQMASKVGGALLGVAAGVATGGAAFAGRKFVGSYGANMLGNKTLLDNATKKGVPGMAARMALRTAKGASTASFDARGTGAFKKIAKSADMDMSGYGLVDAGKAGGKGGYNAMIDGRIKTEQERAQLYAGKSNDEKIKEEVSKAQVQVISAQLERIKEQTAAAKEKSKDVDKHIYDEHANTNEKIAAANERHTVAQASHVAAQAKYETAKKFNPSTASKEEREAFDLAESELKTAKDIVDNEQTLLSKLQAEKSILDQAIKNSLESASISLHGVNFDDLEKGEKIASDALKRTKSESELMVKELELRQKERRMAYADVVEEGERTLKTKVGSVIGGTLGVFSAGPLGAFVGTAVGASAGASNPETERVRNAMANAIRQQGKDWKKKDNKDDLIKKLAREAGFEENKEESEGKEKKDESK